MIRQLLDAVTSTGPGDSLTWPVSDVGNIWDYLLPPNPNHSIQINITGAPDVVTVDLEGSLDGVFFQPIGSHTFSPDEISAGHALATFPDFPVEHVRLNLKTLTAGTNPTVTGFYMGFECKRHGQ